MIFIEYEYSYKNLVCTKQPFLWKNILLCCNRDDVKDYVKLDVNHYVINCSIIMN